MHGYVKECGRLNAGVHVQRQQAQCQWEQPLGESDCLKTCFLLLLLCCLQQEEETCFEAITLAERPLVLTLLFTTRQGAAADGGLVGVCALQKRNAGTRQKGTPSE
jgi:hypothetical protein